jgi:hypothetical protein
MKRERRTIFQTICVLAGILLLTSACAMLFLWQWNIHASRQQTQGYVRTFRSLIPEVQNVALEERWDNSMPRLSLDGEDFIGILEFPYYDSALPVCADWGNTTKYPCCLNGSIYDGSIQIGATSQTGQYDFYREISVGDSVFFTDMEGNRYTLCVSDLRYEKHADQSVLCRGDAVLTLFIKNVYAFEYLIVSCDIPNR